MPHPTPPSPAYLYVAFQYRTPDVPDGHWAVLGMGHGSVWLADGMYNDREGADHSAQLSMYSLEDQQHMDREWFHLPHWFSDKHTIEAHITEAQQVLEAYFASRDSRREIQEAYLAKVKAEREHHDDNG